MSERDDSADRGARTEASGTAFPVHIPRDPQAWITAFIFAGGPILWFAHFMFVYVVAEAGCTGEGQGLRAFNPPVPLVVTLAATALFAAAVAAIAIWALRRWRRGVQAGMAFGGLLLSCLSLIAILWVGVPAILFPGC
jgi:hypothetical protein